MKDHVSEAVRYMELITMAGVLPEMYTHHILFVPVAL